MTSGAGQASLKQRAICRSSRRQSPENETLDPQTLQETTRNANTYDPDNSFHETIDTSQTDNFSVIHELNQGSHYTQGIQQLHTSNIIDPSQCPEKIQYLSLDFGKYQ